MVYLLIEPSCNQLETFFRNLGQRKYLSPREWGTVFRALDSQRTFGRDYDVHVSGKVIGEESLQKKRKNATTGLALATCHAHAGASLNVLIPILRLLTTHDTDQLLTQLPDAVIFRLRLPQDESSMQHSIQPHPVLHIGSGAMLDGGCSKRVADDSASNNAFIGPSTIVPDTGVSSDPVSFRSASTSIAHQVQLDTSPASMGVYPAYALEVSEELDSLMSPPSFELENDTMDLEVDDGTLDFFSYLNIPDRWSRGVSPVNFYQSLQQQGSFSNCHRD